MYHVTFHMLDLRLNFFRRKKEGEKEGSHREFGEFLKITQEPQKICFYTGGWMYLPDLILEHIFKFLTYRVRILLGPLILIHVSSPSFINTAHISCNLL